MVICGDGGAGCSISKSSASCSMQGWIWVSMESVPNGRVSSMMMVLSITLLGGSKDSLAFLMETPITLKG